MPQDGWSQGMVLPLCTLFAPAHVGFVYAMEVLNACGHSTSHRRGTAAVADDGVRLPLHPYRYAKALADPAPSRLPQARLNYLTTSACSPPPSLSPPLHSYNWKNPASATVLMDTLFRTSSIPRKTPRQVAWSVIEMPQGERARSAERSSRNVARMPCGLMTSEAVERGQRADRSP